jgi:hypothetical protein
MAHRPGTKLTTEGPLVAEVFHWANAPTEDFKFWVDYQRAKDNKQTFSGSLAISKNPADDNGVPQAFVDHAADIFASLNYPVQEWRYWFGVTLPGHNDQANHRFAKGFPHAHNWDALTLIHYVQVADEGGDLVQVRPEDHSTINRFTPKPGTTVVVDGYSLHGVESVGGETPRYVLIATGFHADQNLARGSQKRGAA